MSECSERGFGHFGHSRTLRRGWGLAEGISMKNKGDQEFSYLLFMTSRNVLGVVSDILIGQLMVFS